jgi:hypothetical protein
MDMASTRHDREPETAFLELALELSRELHPARRNRLTPDSSLERDAVWTPWRVELLLRAESDSVRLPDHAILSAETFRDLLAAVEAAPCGARDCIEGRARLRDERGGRVAGIGGDAC